MSDRVYLAEVSSAMMEAIREAQDRVAEGETGPLLADIVRHARELHDVLVEELALDDARPPVYADELLVEMGNRLRMLEHYLRAH